MEDEHMQIELTLIVAPSNRTTRAKYQFQCDGKVLLEWWDGDKVPSVADLASRALHAQATMLSAMANGLKGSA
jgi:hypothetical protein